MKYEQELKLPVLVNDILLTAHDVAEILRVNVKKVYSMPITQVRISDRRVRYRRNDVMTYLNQRLLKVAQ